MGTQRAAQQSQRRATMRRWRWQVRVSGALWVLCLLCCLLPNLTHGRSRTQRSSRDEQSEDHVESSRLRQEGLAALQAAQLADAARLLSAAYVAGPSAQGLYSLGLLALAEKRELDAHDLMRRYLADPDLERESESATAAATGPVTTQQAEIKEAERVLSQKRPPAGTLNILGERGTRVYIDGRLVGVLPLSLPLLLGPSEHKVVLERGRQRIEDQVQVPAGRLAELRSDVSSRALLLSTLPGVLIVSDYRDLPNDLRARLQQAVEKALLSRRLSPLATDLALTLIPESAKKRADCLPDISCQVDLAKQVEAEGVLHVRGERTKDALQLRVAFVDITVEQEAAADEVRLDTTAADPAASLLGIVRRVYEEGSHRPHAELSITCDPADATLTLDGAEQPTCSFAKPVFAQEHHIVVQKPGFSRDERTVPLREGEKRSVAIQLLEPEPAPAPLLPPPVVVVPRRQPRPVWRLAVGGAALVGGLVTAGFGAAMLGVHGQCVRPPEVDGGLCERQYVTQVPGGITLGVGLGVALAGGVLLAIPGPMK